MSWLCVNIYSCSWSVEGGLEKVSQRGEGEILFIEELFSAGGGGRVDRFVTIHYLLSAHCAPPISAGNTNAIQIQIQQNTDTSMTGVKIQYGRSLCFGHKYFMDNYSELCSVPKRLRS